MEHFNDLKVEVGASQDFVEETVLYDKDDEFIMPSQSSERSSTGALDMMPRVDPSHEFGSINYEVVDETVIDLEPDDESSYNVPTQDVLPRVGDSEDLFGTQTQVYDVDETFLVEMNSVSQNIVIPETPLRQKKPDESILKTPRLSLLNSPDYCTSRKDQLICATESQSADTQPAGIDHTIVIDSEDDTPKKKSSKSEKIVIFNSEWSGKDLKDVVVSVLGKDESGSQESLNSLLFSPKTPSRGKFLYEVNEEGTKALNDDTCNNSVLETIEDNDESTIQGTQNPIGNSVFINITSNRIAQEAVACSEADCVKEKIGRKSIEEVVVEIAPVKEACGSSTHFKRNSENEAETVQSNKINVSDTESCSRKFISNHSEKSKVVQSCDLHTNDEKTSVGEEMNVVESEVLVISDTEPDNLHFNSNNENKSKEVPPCDHFTIVDKASDDEQHLKDDFQEKTISPEHFHTAPETIPDTEAATAEAMPSPENENSPSPAKEDSTPQILRKSYTFFLEVTGCVELCSNTNTLLKKEIIAVKDRSSGNSNCILESWSESTDKSKRESMSSAGSVYSDKVGLPFTLMPRMSLASVQTSSTSTVEEVQFNPVNKVEMDDIQPWKNDCLMALACDEALVKQLTLNHLSRTYSRDIKHNNKKKLIKRVSQANKILFHKNENIEEILPENQIVKQYSLSKILPLDVPKITPLEKSTPIIPKSESIKEAKCIEETPMLVQDVKNQTPTGRKRGRPATNKMKGVSRTESCLSESSSASDCKPPAKKAAIDKVVAEKIITRKRNINSPLETPRKRKCKEVVVLSNEGSSPIKTTLPTISETKPAVENETVSSGSVQRRLRSTSKSEATPPSTSTGSRTPRRKTPRSTPSSLSGKVFEANMRSKAIDSSADSSPGLKENNRRKKLSHLITSDLEFTPGLEMDETVVNNTGPKQARGKTSKSKKKILEEPDYPETVKRLGPIPDGHSKIFSGIGFLLCYVRPRKRTPLKKTGTTSNSDFSMSESEDFQLYDMHHNFEFDETRLKRQIVAGGGVIYDRFNEIPPSKYSSTKLVTNRPNRSAKFLLCFIYNIPIVLHLHIIEACRNGNFSAMKLYHIGWSDASQRWLDKPKQIHKTFDSKSIYLHSKSEDSVADSLFVNFWTIVLEKSGAIITQDPNYADVIIADTSLPHEIHGSVQALGNNAPTLVSINWAIESLLHGKLLNSTMHPSFAYNCSYTSS